MQEKKSSFAALLPIAIFLVIYIGGGILFQDFYAMPAIVVFLIALAVAFLQNRGLKFNEKMHLIAEELSDDNIITMCLIFLLAGCLHRCRHRRRRRGFHRQPGADPPAWRSGRGGAVRHRLFHLHLHGHQRRHHLPPWLPSPWASVKRPALPWLSAWALWSPAPCSVTTCP